MRLAVLICCLLGCVLLKAQSLSGKWAGTITRDYGDETKTDSILFELTQEGDKIKGYSLLLLSNSSYIKSSINGVYISATKTLRLTETDIAETNIPLKDDLFFLDRYILSVDAGDMNTMSGKSICYENKQVYTRSKMKVRRL